MPSHVTLRETLNIGTPIVLESPSPQTHYAVVFEDDGETAYFYGLDTNNETQPILDALHIYNVSNVVDADTASALEIVWTEDGFKACLTINDAPHAIFDFESRRAICRNNFPPPDNKFTNSHEWDERALEIFN